MDLDRVVIGVYTLPVTKKRRHLPSMAITIVSWWLVEDVIDHVRTSRGRRMSSQLVFVINVFMIRTNFSCGNSYRHSKAFSPCLSSWNPRTTNTWISLSVPQNHCHSSLLNYFVWGNWSSWNCVLNVLCNSSVIPKTVAAILCVSFYQLLESEIAWPH